MKNNVPCKHKNKKTLMDFFLPPASRRVLEQLFPSPSCEVCLECETCPECVECDAVYEDEDTYCKEVVYEPLTAQYQKALNKAREEHKEKLSELDFKIKTLEEQKTGLQNDISSQETDIETLNRWLHCETSTDPKGYKEADNQYEADFKGKPYWENQLQTCNTDIARYDREKATCETWLGVCNEYLAPYCIKNSGSCKDWWTAPPANYDSGERHCTDQAASDATELQNPPLTVDR